MNKFELVSQVAEKTGLKKKEADEVIDAVLETIQETLVAGENVKLIGFGTFDIKVRKARIGRNPKNPSVEIEIPESKAPVFKPGKQLKDAINNEIR